MRGTQESAWLTQYIVYCRRRFRYEMQMGGMFELKMRILGGFPLCPWNQLTVADAGECPASSPKVLSTLYLVWYISI